MKKYMQYLKYVLKHKKEVFRQCVKRKMFWHAITHDLSKFRPSEFFAYAEKFYGRKPNPKKMTSVVEAKFEAAWLHHKNRNKHHWNYWVDGHGKPIPMPRKYVKQLICDWEAMGAVFGNSAASYFESKKQSMNLHAVTEYRISKELGLS